MLRESSENVQEHLRGIVQTYYRRHALVIASHIAILSGSVEKEMGNQVVVKEKHMEEAIKIITNVFSRLPALLSEIYSRDKNADNILLREELSERWNIDKEEILKEIEKQGGNVKYKETIDNIVEILFGRIKTRYGLLIARDVKNKLNELARENVLEISKNRKTIKLIKKKNN